ncbi:MAG: D-alanine--D-alanine ligase [Xanthomonadales bacterium]|nr:D-alanine--D-alanine ligase [Gammaproteobacteria bacterium]NNL95641.1 D-alanine--D-alanine ligase [Xanthomonadales bacterium]
MKLNDPREFGHVGLLLGGESAERDVSLDGGAAIGRSFDRSAIAYSVFDGADGLFDAIRDGGIDRVFNLMHGPGGEDGAIQGALQLMKVPVTGTGVLGSALTMDKVRSKWIMQRLGLPTADFEILDVDDDVPEIGAQFGFPVFVKPSGLGSSIGVSKVKHSDKLEQAVELARQYSPQVLIERAIEGGEYFAAVLGRTVLPLIRIETPREFYDYQAKYHSDQTTYHCPSGLDAETENRLQAVSLQVFDALHASGWGRVDFILDSHGNPCFLEVNTAPGMTDHSLVPQAADQAGVGFDELVWRILETSL